MDVLFSPVLLLVSLFITRITQKSTEPISTTLGGGMGHGPGKKTLYFGADPVKGTEPGIYI